MPLFQNSKNPLLLVKSLEKNYSPDRTIAEQIKEHYVCSPWNTIYEKHSWMGRIAVWLRYPSEKTQSEKKVVDSFTEVFRSVYQNKTQFKELDDQFGKNLIQEFESFLIDDPRSDLFPTPEFSYFEDLKLEQELSNETKIRERSLLGLLDERSESLTLEQFKSILSGDHEISSETFNILENYFNKHPDCAVADWREVLGSIRRGHEERGLAQQKIKKAGKLSSESEKRKQAKELAQETIDKLNALAPGESYQFNCSYGCKKLTLESLLALFQKLPAALKNELPPSLSNTDELPDPAKFVEGSIHQFVEKLKAETPALAEIFQSLPIGGLFPDENREVSNWCQKCLPLILSSYIEEFMKNGLIKDCTVLTNSENFVLLANWLADAGKAIYETDGQEAFMAALEKEIQKLGSSTVEQLLEVFNSQLGELCRSFAKHVPPALFDAMGLENFAYSGPLWYKVVKNKDGETFDLEIYTLGNALQLHSIANTHLVSWPLGIEGLLPGELNEELFERIFYHFIASQQDPTSSLTVQDLYEGTFQTLLSKRKNREVKFQSELVSLPSNDLELTLSLLFKEEAKKNNATFAMRLELFLDFCKPLFKDRKLISTNQETCRFLLETIRELEKTARFIYKNEDGKVKLKQIIATRKEIERALNQSNKNLSFFEHGEFSLPPQLREEIHRILAEHHISKATLESFKNTLEWAFGNEIGRFIDAIIASFGEILPAESIQAAPQKNPEGVASQTLTALYFNLIMKGMKYALFAAGLYQIGWSYLLIFPLARFLLPSLLPAHVYEWYARFESAVARSLVQMTFHLILDCLISKKTRVRLERIAGQWNALVANWREKLDRTESLFFDVEMKDREIDLTPIKHPSRIPPDADYEAVPAELEDLEGEILIHSYPSVEKNTAVSKENLHLFLQTILDDLHHENLEIRELSYILLQISKLEVPQAEGGFWNEIDRPEEYLPLLAEIGCQCHALFMKEQSKSLLYQNPADFTLCFYHLLAITDCLARRTPDWDIEAKANAYPLLKRYQLGMRFTQPEHGILFKKLCEYFFPNVDPAKLSKTKIEFLERQSLFNHHIYVENSYYELQSVPEFLDLDGIVNISRIEGGKKRKALPLLTSIPELIYLEKLMKDPANKSKLAELGAMAENKKGDTPARMSVIGALLSESTNLHRPDSIIPQPYKYLRLQTLIAAQTAALQFSKEPATQLLIPPEDEKKRVLHSRNWRDYLNIRYWRSPPPESLKTSYHPFPEYNLNYYTVNRLISSRSTQTQTMTETDFYSSLEDAVGMENVRDLYLVMTEQNDRILRALEWMKKNKGKVVLSDENKCHFVFEIFEEVFFTPNALTEQLHASPLSAIAINQFLKELIEYHIHQNNILTSAWLIHRGLRIKQFIEKETPQHTRTAPDFYEMLLELETKATDLSESKILAALKALTLEAEWDSTEKDSKISAAVSLCQAYLSDPPSIFLKEPYSVLGTLLLDIYRLFNLYSNELDALLQDENIGHKIFEKILDEKGILFPNETKIKRLSFLKYRIGNMILDLNKGAIISAGILQSTKKPSFEEVLKYSELASFKETFAKLKFNPTDDGYISEDGVYEIKVKNHSFPVIYRNINGTRYKKTTRTSMFWCPRNNLLEAAGINTEKPYIVWRETGVFNPKTCLHQEHTPELLSFFYYDASTNQDIYLSGPNHNEAIVPCRLSQIKHRLTPLACFCPLDKIDCLVSTQSRKIHSFKLTPYNLSFEVIASANEGPEKAICKQGDLAGYQISSVQKHERLESIGSYLILENNGQKAVLIPSGMSLFSPLWKLASLLGPLGQMITGSLTPENFDPNIKEAKYYSYQINEKGQLSSQDPYALAYLMTLQILQGDMKEAKVSFKQLELLLNSRPVDTNKILKELMPIAFIPPTLENLSYLRLKLMSALERNRLVQLSPQQKEEEPEEIEALFLGMFNLTFFIDYNIYLNEAHPYLKLNDGEEYFLYKFFINSITRNINKFIESNSKTREFLLKYGPIPFIENFIFPQQMREKWDFLKKKYQIEESSPVKAYRWIKRLGTAAGFFPSASMEEISAGAGEVAGKAGSSLGKLVKGAKFISPLFQNRDSIYKNLHQEMLLEVTLPPLQAEEFNSSNLKKYFASYFAIATGEYSDEAIRNKLIYLLQLNKGGWDEDSRHLLNLLEGTFQGFIGSRFTVDALLKSARIIVSQRHKELLDEMDSFHQKKEKLRQQIDDLKEEITRTKKTMELPLHHLFAQKERVFKMIEEINRFPKLPRINQKSLLQSELAEINKLVEVQKKIIERESAAGNLIEEAKIELNNLIHKQSEYEIKLRIIEYKKQLRGIEHKIKKRNQLIEDYTVKAEVLLSKKRKKYNWTIAVIATLEKRIEECLQGEHSNRNLKYRCPDWFDFFDSLTNRVESKRVGFSILNTTALNPLWVADYYCKSHGAYGMSGYIQNFTAFAAAPREMAAATFTQENLNGFMDYVQTKIQEGPDSDPVDGRIFERYYNLAAEIFPALKPREEEAIDCPYTPPDYSPLANEESVINKQLRAQFDLLFEEREVEVEEAKIEHFEYKGDEPHFHQHFEKVNQSIDQFCKNQPKTRKEIRVRDLKSITLVYRNLNESKITFQKQLKRDKKRLIENFAFINGHQNYTKDITLADLWKFIESFKGNALYTKGATVEQVQLLELALAKYEHRRSRLNQIENALKEMEALIEARRSQPLEKLDRSQINFIEAKLETLADILMAQTTFSFTQTPLKLVRTYLRYQSKSGKLMWKRQVERLKIQMGENNDNSMNQQACSDGKTSVLIPNAIQAKGDGSNLVLVISPKPVSGTLFNVISSLVGDLFSKSSFRHHHERGIKLNTEALDSLYVTLLTAKENGDPVFMTREDVESLYAIFIDNLHHYVHVSRKNNDDEKKGLILLQKILKMIGTEGFAIVDEAHDIYDQTKKLNLPIGDPKTISENYFNTAKNCISILLDNPKFRAHVEKNEMYKLSKKEYHNVIIPDAARKIAQSFDILDPVQVDEFQGFFCNTCESIPAWLQKHPKYKEICLTKGIVKILIEDVRKQKNRSDVDFGPSKEGNGEFARPYEGNSSPVEEATIQDPYETLIKTFLNILATGLSAEQTKKLFYTLSSKIKFEMKTREVPYNETRIFKLIDNESLASALLSPDEKHDWEKISKTASANKELLFFYIRYFIWKKIEYWDFSIQVDSQKFANLVPKQHAGTGTPYNEGTYAPHINLLDDLETTGESLHTIISKCPDTDINVLKSYPGDELIPENILSRIFDIYLADSMCSMIIDGGALFTGLSSEFVAREMLRYAKKYRPEIEHVKFFMKDEQQIDQIYVLNDPDGLPTLAEKTKYPPETCITFIDHPHGVAASILQKNPGYAVETFGPMHPLYRKIQESFRELRDPKKKGRLAPLLEEYAVERSQMIRFVTTEDIAKMMRKVTQGSEERNPTVHEGFECGIFSEAKLIAKENWESMRPKINEIPHHLIFKKILDSNFNTAVSLYEEFEEKVFLTHLETNPAKIYGFLPKKIPRKEALNIYAAGVAAKFEYSQGLSKEERETIRRSIHNLPEPELQPDEVTVYHAGGKDAEIRIGLFDQLNQRLQNHHQQENKVEEQDEEEDQEEVDLQQNTQVQKQKTAHRFTEWQWQEDAALGSIEWLKLSNSEAKSFSQKGPCPLFSIVETLENSKNKALSRVAKSFESFLWYPNNWLPRWVESSLRSRSVGIGTYYQRGLYEILIHFEETPEGTKIMRAAPLSQHDAAIWREKMRLAAAEDPHFWEKQPVKALLWDVHNRTVAAGYQPSDFKKFKKDKQLKKAVVNLKFLNGDVDYKHHMKTLQKWFETSDNPRQLAEAFKAIHAQRGTKSIPGSDIDFILSQYLPELY